MAYRSSHASNRLRHPMLTTTAFLFSLERLIFLIWRRWRTRIPSGRAANAVQLGSATEDENRHSDEARMLGRVIEKAETRNSARFRMNFPESHLHGISRPGREMFLTSRTRILRTRNVNMRTYFD
jgi:hypothetical protein